MTDYIWNNPSSGLWEDAGNWTPFTGFAPGEFDNATVTGVATTQLNVTQDDDVNDLSLRDANATLNDFGGPAFLNVFGVFTLGKGHVSLFDTGILNIFDVANINGGSIFAQNGTVQVEDGAILNERAGQITLGANSEIDINQGGTWNIRSNDGIRSTAPGSAEINNDGTLEKTGGAGTSVIAGRVDNTGFIEVGVGEIEFRNQVFDSGSAILFNRSALQFDQAVNIPVVEFTGGNETLTLNKPQFFNAEIEGFGFSDVVKLLGNWHLDSISHPSGFTDVTLNKGTTTATLDFTGNLNLHVHSGTPFTTITT